ncbi:MAG TPA: hypothetical protein VKW08_17070 [Xanthobacteraceae bacterium]|nr:hypothetical protein [Xanthobacteraceae bacterium]
MKSSAKPFGAGALGLSLILGMPIAQAQTVTRQITDEPVETTVTQYPDGTEVTRRILSPEPFIGGPVAPLGTYAPLSGAALGPQYVEPAAPVLTRRQTVTTSATSTVGAGTVGEAIPPAPRSHTKRTRTVTSHTTVATARAPHRAPPSTVGFAPAPPPVSDAALVLSPAQRQIIYRSVVEQQYIPPAAPSYPLRTVYPADNAYPYEPAPDDYSYASPYYPAATYAETYPDYRDPYHPAYRWDGVPLVVGARMPVSVPLVLMPQPVVASVPIVQPYSYAYVDNHVYLVDPATRVIVAEVTP